MEKRTVEGRRKKYLYTQENFTNITVSFNKNTDIELINYLNKTGNKSSYIKQLIREDMKKEGIEQ